MKFEHKLLIDHVAGSFLCWALNLYAQTKRKIFSQAKRARETPRAVLFLKFVGIGSICRSSFLLNACKKKYPSSRLIFASFSDCARFVGLYNEVDKVLVIRDRNFLVLCWDTLKTLLWCRSNGVDLVVDLEVHSKYSSIFTALTGAERQAGFHYISSRFRRGLYSTLVYWNPLRHVDESYRQMAQALGFDEASPAPRPVTPDVERKKLRALFKEWGVKDSDRLLCVNPNSGPLSLERRWPAEHFSKMISSIPRDENLHVLLLGNESEKNYVESVKALIGGQNAQNVRNTAGALSLPMLIELLKKSSLFVTNDSGPLHLADLLGTPTLSLWGPTIPALYGPTSANHKTFYQSIYCSPCVHITEAPPCGGDNQCLKRLAWEPVGKEIALRLGYSS